MGTEDTLVTGHHRFPAGCQGVGRRHHFWQRDLCASRYSGSMTDEGGHKICNQVSRANVNKRQRNIWELLMPDDLKINK